MKSFFIILYENILNLYRSGGIVGEKKQATGVEHLWGVTHLDESILDLNLEVSPSFYFHWNTYGAEQLYNAVVELAGVDSETTVLDLCCGSGGMGLTLAKVRQISQVHYLTRFYFYIGNIAITVLLVILILNYEICSRV